MAMMKSESYRRTAARALGWIVRHRGQFRLRGDERRRVALSKPLGELALTADVLMSWSRAPSAAYRAGRELLSFCWDEFGRGEMMRALVWREPDLLVFGSLYETFHRHGLRNALLPSALREASRLTGVRALEFPAWRRLEMAMAYRRLGIPTPWPVAKAFKDTWLSSRPEPWALTVSAAYSLTHTVFYRTAFGRSPSRLPFHLREYLQRWCPVWIHHYRDIENYDLVAEMIMVLRCIRAPDTGDFAAMLSAGQAANGMIRGPAGAGRGLDPFAQGRVRRTFLDNYHTTLVALMAAQMSAADGE
jgi:hypothetical protein